MCSGVARAMTPSRAASSSSLGRMPERGAGELALLLGRRVRQRVERRGVRQEVEARGRRGCHEHEGTHAIAVDQRRLEGGRATEAVTDHDGSGEIERIAHRHEILGVLGDRAARPVAARAARAAADEVERGHAMGLEVESLDERVPCRVVVLEAVQQHDVRAPSDLADGDLHAADRHRPHVVLHARSFAATT